MNYEASHVRPAFEATCSGYLSSEASRLKLIAPRLSSILKNGGSPRERAIYRCIMWCIENPRQWDVIRAPLKLTSKPRGWSDENPFFQRIPVSG